MFNKKKRYFNRKLDGVQKMIWDDEFKREKSLMIKEEIRREYDGTKSKIEVLTNQIKSQLKNPEKICEVHNPEKGKEPILKAKGKCVCEYIEKHMPIDDHERLYDQRVLLVRDQGRYEAQMQQIDLDVFGSPKTNQYPDGVGGINDRLDSLRELQGFYKAYVKTI